MTRAKIKKIKKRIPIEALHKWAFELEKTEPCSCEHSLCMKEILYQLLDWIDYEADEAPHIDLFDCAVRLTNWEYNQLKDTHWGYTD